MPGGVAPTAVPQGSPGYWHPSSDPPPTAGRGSGVNGLGWGHSDPVSIMESHLQGPLTYSVSSLQHAEAVLPQVCEPPADAGVALVSSAGTSSGGHARPPSPPLSPPTSDDEDELPSPPRRQRCPLPASRPLGVVTPAVVVPQVDTCDVELRVTLLAIVHALRRGDQWPPPGLGEDPSVHWLEAVAQWHLGLPASRPLGMAPTGHQASAGCQVWLETAQIARGELEVSRLRSGAPREPNALLAEQLPPVVVAVADGGSYAGSQVARHNALFPLSPRRLGLKHDRAGELLQLCAPLVTELPPVSELSGPAPSDSVVVLGDPGSAWSYTWGGVQVHALAAGADPKGYLLPGESMVEARARAEHLPRAALPQPTAPSCNGHQLSQPLRSPGVLRAGSGAP